jgi:hypothetical protein
MKTESKKAYLQALYDNRLLRTEEELRAFVQALHELKSEPDKSILDKLLAVLDDSVSDINPQQALLSYVEKFDLNSFVNAVVSATPLLYENAPGWLRHIYRSTLYTADYRAYLKDLFLELQVEHQNLIREVLNSIPNQTYFSSEEASELQHLVDDVLVSSDAQSSGL